MPSSIATNLETTATPHRGKSVVLDLNDRQEVEAVEEIARAMETARNFGHGEVLVSLRYRDGTLQFAEVAPKKQLKF